jgi:hypothetical protein
MSQRAIIFSS